VFCHSLGLDIHLLQAKPVERDHAVNAAIADAADTLEVIATSSDASAAVRSVRRPR
jgi:hypothetical protein